MKKSVLILSLLLLGLTACAPSITKVPVAEVEPTEELVVMPPQPQTPGSLWTGSLPALASDRKGRNVGDIVTVAIFENARASKEASTKTERDSSVSAGIDNFFGLEQSLPSKMDPTKLIGATAGNSFSGSGKTSRAENLIASLTTQIIEIYPNGNLRISGNKTVTVNNEMQIVQLSGIVRTSDISPSNVIDSKNILNARISYKGQGVLSDKQRPGWLVRTLDTVWPF